MEAPEPVRYMTAFLRLSCKIPADTEGFSVGVQRVDANRGLSQEQPQNGNRAATKLLRTYASEGYNASVSHRSSVHNVAYADDGLFCFVFSIRFD